MYAQLDTDGVSVHNGLSPRNKALARFNESLPEGWDEWKYRVGQTDKHVARPWISWWKAVINKTPRFSRSSRSFSILADWIRKIARERTEFVIIRGETERGVIFGRKMNGKSGIIFFYRELRFRGNWFRKWLDGTSWLLNATVSRTEFDTRLMNSDRFSDNQSVVRAV